MEPADNDWKAFEKKVNHSIIRLFKEALSNKVQLPDDGAGYKLWNQDPSSLQEEIDRHDKGEYVRFVTYGK